MIDPVLGLALILALLGASFVMRARHGGPRGGW